MRYLTIQECLRVGYMPYVTTRDGRVESFICLGFVIDYGSEDYGGVVEQVEEMVE
jgi:hypothetical protein